MEDEEEMYKENHKTKKGKICFRQKKLLNMESQFITFSSPDHEMPRLPGIPKIILEAENNTIRSNPVLLPMETREEKTDYHYDIDNNRPTSDNGKYQDEHVKKQKVNHRSNRSPRITPRETTRYQKEGTGLEDQYNILTPRFTPKETTRYQKEGAELEDRYNILTPRFTPKETRCYTKEGVRLEDGYNILTPRSTPKETTRSQKEGVALEHRSNILTPVKQHLQSRALDETLQQRFVTPRRDENNLNPGVIPVDRSSVFEQNDFKQNTSGLLLCKSTKKLTSDELLLKLTMSLPMRLLLKTDQALNDLSSVLGFEDRRNQLLHRERSIVEQSPMNDDRFTKLMNTLEKQDKNLKL